MVFYGVPGLAIVLLFALALTIPLTLIVAAFGLRRRIRAHKAWPRSVAFLCCLVFLQIVAFFNSRSIAESYDDAIRAWYTHHLTRPEDFGGMTFPAGSTVVLDVHAPHAVKSGTVPPDTPLLGLTLNGDFRITRFDTATGYVAEGTLARPASFDGIACAPGPFTHYREHNAFEYEMFSDEVDCTLAAEFRYRELDLPAGTHVKVLNTDGTHAESISGVLPRPWKIFGIQCDAGAFEFDSFERFSCSAAVDQRVGDYTLLRGKEIMVSREQDGSLRIYGGD